MPAEDNDRISLVERAVRRMNDGDAAGSPDKPVQAKSVAKKTVAKRAQAANPVARPEKQGGKASSAAKPVDPKSTVRLDLGGMRKKGMITPTSGRTHLVEDMRFIKRPILNRAFVVNDNDGSDTLNNVVMISSCRSGEGKTFTAVNLAMSMAMERDLYVLLIDTDVYRRGACELLGVEPKKGLVDLILDPEMQVSDVMQRTNVSNLSIIQAGTLHPHATELLASQRMLDIVSDISARYPDRIVVIDTPPVLLSSEPTVLAGIAGQIILVVEEGKTSKQQIDEALEGLREAENISFILNKQRGRRKRNANYEYSTRN
ncbi:XrtA-associated tyrosine autokinase [Aestuariispira insulae]|uniref:non-specific protein-tyrosine kinase n=1 Tax=Aestuariispira insulae TaxID=1461337 RepID=A0A3D9HKP5_9PROT|nr:XrtA-associated tyrosine autokinase [Aestuariispira insulae]RED49861.1 exopolysaccharide/PEP-CTERM locus tyrosine autokinase [Aestuariispira insulae]